MEHNMKPVQIGVIGCGVIGRMHLRVAADSPLLTPVAVADVREAVAQEVAAQHGVARAYASAEALLADPEIEAVVLALPTAGRAELALAAFSAGKHVLVEKPIALNAGEVRQHDRGARRPDRRLLLIAHARAALGRAWRRR